MHGRSMEVYKHVIETCGRKGEPPEGKTDGRASLWEECVLDTLREVTREGGTWCSSLTTVPVVTRFWWRVQERGPELFNGAKLYHTLSEHMWWKCESPREWFHPCLAMLRPDHVREFSRGIGECTDATDGKNDDKGCKDAFIMIVDALVARRVPYGDIVTPHAPVADIIRHVQECKASGDDDGARGPGEDEPTLAEALIEGHADCKANCKAFHELIASVRRA